MGVLVCQKAGDAEHALVFLFSEYLRDSEQLTDVVRGVLIGDGRHLIGLVRHGTAVVFERAGDFRAQPFNKHLHA